MSASIYLVRHGEVEHHRTDVSLTPRGREQAAAAGVALAERVQAGESVFVFHSPVTRVAETARILYASMATALQSRGLAGRITLQPPQPDESLHNVRFFVDGEREPIEPSLLYAATNNPDYLRTLPAPRAAFYRGFWASPDPMKYWMDHDSHGGAESLPAVLRRLRNRLREIIALDGPSTRHAHWIMVTHAGTMRTALCDALPGDPGEPDFCEQALIRPADERGQASLSFRGQTVQIEL